MKKSTLNFLKEKGYKEYISPFPKQLEGLQEQRNFQAVFYSRIFCDTNEKKFINIEFIDWTFKNHSSKTFEISLTGEKENIWFELKTFSLTEKQLIEKLDSIEAILINMFSLTNRLKQIKIK